MIRTLIARGAAALALLSLAVATPAAAGSLTVKDGNGTSQSIATTTCQTSALCYNMDTVIVGTSNAIGASVTAATATTLATLPATVRGWAVQNQTAGDCYVRTGTAATQDYNSLKVVSGSYFDTPPTHVASGILSVICASAGGVYARYW